MTERCGLSGKMGCGNGNCILMIPSICSDTEKRFMCLIWASTQGHSNIWCWLVLSSKNPKSSSGQCTEHWFVLHHPTTKLIIIIIIIVFLLAIDHYDIIANGNYININGKRKTVNVFKKLYHKEPRPKNKVCCVAFCKIWGKQKYCKTYLLLFIFIKSKSPDNRQRLITTGAFILKFEICSSIFCIKMCEYKGHDLVCTFHTDYSHFCVYRL